MAIESYSCPPILVNISDTVIGGTRVKRRARRIDVTMTDHEQSPVLLNVEVIPYACEPDGSYGPELTSGIFRRCPHPLQVSPLRLVDQATGRILASRYNADNSLRPDAEWAADVARIQADETVVAMFQNEWFRRMMREQPAIVDVFTEQNILLADLSGDLG